MAKPLSERIASARSTDRINIRDLVQLIADANAERDRLTRAAAREDNESVELSLSEAARDDAAAFADRYRRTATGLSDVIAELTAKLDAKRNSDSQRAKAAERDAAIAERDELVQRLKTEWPAIEAQIVGLLSAMKLSDARLKQHTSGELGAENVARGASGLLGYGVTNSLYDTRLPALERSAADGLADARKAARHRRVCASPAGSLWAR